jgi:hypothetical protein
LVAQGSQLVSPVPVNPEREESGRPNSREMSTPGEQAQSVAAERPVWPCVDEPATHELAEAESAGQNLSAGHSTISQVCQPQKRTKPEGWLTSAHVGSAKEAGSDSMTSKR